MYFLLSGTSYRKFTLKRVRGKKPPSFVVSSGAVLSPMIAPPQDEEHTKLRVLDCGYAE
jgi:hypothetical protein